jgi:transposase
MGRRRRSFTAEFKLEAVRLANKSGKPPGEIARDLGIRPDILRRWRAELTRTGHGASHGASPGPVVTPEEEVRLLRRENALLREEREILKKATAFFAKDAR